MGARSWTQAVRCTDGHHELRAVIRSSLPQKTIADNRVHTQQRWNQTPSEQEQDASALPRTSSISEIFAANPRHEPSSLRFRSGRPFLRRFRQTGNSAQGGSRAPPADCTGGKTLAGNGTPSPAPESRERRHARRASAGPGTVSWSRPPGHCPSR